MRLLIVGTLNGQLSTATKLAMDKGATVTHATDIALLAAPEVAAGRLLAAEAATPIYLRDNVAHVAQPPKAPATPP